MITQRLRRIGLIFLSAFFLAHFSSHSSEKEVLYNGIVLSDPWPPPIPELTEEPMDVPYLKNIPKVIPIDIGRQLFVDDFLISSTTLKKQFHSAVYVKENPVIAPDKPWEQTGKSPTAMPYSDGVWFDPTDHLFKMWYMCGYTVATCYATSKDGLRWEKPSLDVVPGTNIVQPDARDGSTTLLDWEEKDLQKRFKLFQTGGKPFNIKFFNSPDGIHWGKRVHTSGPAVDALSTIYFNPFRRVWEYSIRGWNPGGERIRRYREGKDLFKAADWNEIGDPQNWVAADKLDVARPDYQFKAQLYNLTLATYESVTMGLMTIIRGNALDQRPKINEVFLAFSRDGFHWDRSDRMPFLPVSENPKDFNYGNVQSVASGCLIVGDELYFYCSGRNGGPAVGRIGSCFTGLAKLRRDGFASMDAAKGPGMLITNVVSFNGRYLFVNLDSPGGELRVSILDKDGAVMSPFTSKNCVPVKGNKTMTRVQWAGADNLDALKGKPVRFRFELSSGRLYSFWVSPDEQGHSNGYVAAGGPGFTSNRDR